LTQEALSSRNALVDQVVAVQSQISEVQDELENTSSQCRQAQAENRALHKALQQLQQQQSKERDKDATSEELERRNRLLKRVVADLIVGADLDLYNDARLAGTLRKLE
jgi:regulator of replication initiation timing